MSNEVGIVEIHIVLPDNHEKKLCDLLNPDSHPQLYGGDGREGFCRALEEISALKGEQLDDLLVVPQPGNLPKTGDELFFVDVFPCNLQNQSPPCDRCPGRKLRSGNVVGRITVAEGDTRYHFEVNPRFGTLPEGRYWWMLWLLYRTDIINITRSSAHLALQEGLDDLMLFLLWLRLLQRAAAIGPYREQRRVLQDERVLRGTIDIPRYLQHNIYRNDRLPCSLRERLYQNPIAYLILAVVDYWEKKAPQTVRAVVSMAADLRIFLGLLKQFCPDYSFCMISRYLPALQRPIRHPFYLAYEPVRAVGINILRREAVEIAQPGRREVYGWLVDMAYLFQRYLSLLCKELDPELCDDRDFPLFDKRERTVRPDILIKREGDASIVVDAKYKGSIDPGRAGDEHRADIYQILSYMLRFRARKGVLSFPAPETGDDREAGERLRKFVICETDCRLYTLGLRVPQVETSDLHKLMEAFRTAERQWVNDLKAVIG